jgi:hypothetical protein
MRKSSFGLSALTTLVLFVTACGSDSIVGVNEGDELTDAEIQALFNEMSGALGALGLGLAPPAAEGMSLAPAANVPINESFSESAPCQSGSVGLSGSVSGNIDDQTFEGDLTLDFTVDFNACLVNSTSGTFTVNGAPSIRFEADFLFSQTALSVNGTQKGGFSFTTSDQRTGSCAIDVSFDVSVNQGTSTATSVVSGTVCGKDASAFETYTSG